MESQEVSKDRTVIQRMYNQMRDINEQTFTKSLFVASIIAGAILIFYGVRQFFPWEEMPLIGTLTISVVLVSVLWFAYRKQFFSLLASKAKLAVRKTFDWFAGLKLPENKIRAITVIIAFVSSLTTYIGLSINHSAASSELERVWVPVLVTIAVGLMMIGFVLLVLNWLDHMKNGSFQWFKVVAIGFGIPIYFLVVFQTSSYWSVLTMGGNSAQNIHLRQTVKDAQDQYLEAVAFLAEQNRYPSMIGQLADNFAEMQSSEGLGAVTGFAGEGPIYQQLGNISKTMGTLRGSLVDALKAPTHRLDTLRMYNNSLGNIVASNLPLQEKLLVFADTLSMVNALTQSLFASSVIPNVQTVMNSIEGLSFVKNPATTGELGESQRQVVVAIKGAIKTVRDEIALYTDEIKEGKGVSQSSLVMLEPAEAVLKYWKQIPWAWGTALAMDFFPMFLLFIHTAVVYKRRRSEARQLNRGVQAVPAAVMQ